MYKFFATATIVLAFQFANSHISSAAGLEVSGEFARASAGLKRNGVIFFTVKNQGRNDNTLVSVLTDVSKRAELHGHSTNDGVMRMSKIKGGIQIPAGSIAQLKPGGFHVMLLGLKAPLKKGETIYATLLFKDGHSIKINVPILGVGAKSTIGHSDMNYDGMMKKGMKHHH